MTRPLDVVVLLRCLAAHGVEYLVIGGVAVQVHGHPRTTRDLDLIPYPARANLTRLREALKALNASPVDLPGAGPPTEDQLRLAAVVPPLMTDGGELHLLNEVPGAASWQDMRARALDLTIEDVPVPVVALDDLIAMKRAAGRDRDLRDIEVLTAVEREARGG